MYYDLSAFAGHWPFRRLRNGEIGAELEHLKKYGIGGGLISSLDAIFYNDPWEADGELAELLREKGFRAAVCVNPDLPHAAAELERHAGSAGAVRLYPGIHGYECPGASELARLAGELGLPVLLTARLEDRRLEYLLRQREVDILKWAELASKTPETRFLFTGFYRGELDMLPDPPENVWADTSGLCHDLFPFEVCAFPADRLVFGSMSPLQCLESAVINVPGELRDGIMGRNPERFLKGEERK